MPWFTWCEAELYNIGTTAALANESQFLGNGYLLGGAFFGVCFLKNEVV